MFIDELIGRERAELQDPSGMQIAYELGVSEAPIKAHVLAVLQKLGVDSRTQAVILPSRIGTGPI